MRPFDQAWGEQQSIAVELSHYVLTPIREDEEFVLYRGEQQDATDTSPRSLLLLTPVSMRPGPHSLKRPEHEYSLKADLDPAWAVRPLMLCRLEGRTMLALENPGGEPLEQLIQNRWKRAPFLRVAADVGATLSKVHRCGLIHKDLKPAHVLLNVASGEVLLMGFGIASRLPRERQPTDVPAPVAAVIAKLLAKTAEDRYQTAAGVEGDLRRCLAEWNSRRQIDAFPLARRDRPDRLLIPEKLYGRAREINCRT